MKDFIKSIILTRNYVLSEMEERIQKMYVLGKLTEEEMTELLNLSAENAKDNQQVDLYAKLVELEERVFALEHPVISEDEPTPVYATWTSGYTTKKGETVLFDYDNDGNLDYLRYDGGRDQTALSPGKIAGWHVVDAEGNILGDYLSGVFTPVEEQEN